MYVYRLHLSFFAFEQSTYNAPGDGYDERKPPAEGQRQESRAKQNAEKQKNTGRDIRRNRRRYGVVPICGMSIRACAAAMCRGDC